jgi:4-amino-4-deoxy-L-arabinose transferase-like glycosyltransferase
MRRGAGTVSIAPATAAAAQHVARPRLPRSRLRPAFAPVAVGLVVFLVSFGVRLIGLDQYSTTDEAYWMQRSIRFGAALARGDLAGTYRAGHPGVSVMWTGLLGMGPDRTAPYFDGRFAQFEVLERTSGYLEAFSAARRAVALVASLLIAAAVVLAGRLLGWGAALTGGTILTLDPYVIGMTRLLHVDALLAPLMAVSALAGLVFWATSRTQARRWPYLLLSLVTGGLALLTKAPAAYLGIFLGLVCLVTAASILRRDGRPGSRLAPLRAITRAGLPLLVWGVGAAAVYVLLFPAIWVDPLGRIDALIRFVQAVGLQPHDGNYFMGRPILDDPGPFYYLVAAPLRISPLVALGIGLLVVPASRAEQRMGARTATRWLLVYVILFAVLMTLGSKKFDRYMLPALLMLDLLAGVGLWRLVVLLIARWPGAFQWRGGGSRLTVAGRGRMGLSPGLLAGTVAAAAAVQLLLLVHVWPYPIAYYNPLAGGAERARQLVMVGWGEGLEQVAGYLNGLPDAESLYVVTSYNHVLRPRFVGTTLAMAPYLQPDTSALQAPDYVVLYINAVQPARRSSWPTSTDSRTPGSIGCRRPPRARPARCPSKRT